VRPVGDDDAASRRRSSRSKRETLQCPECNAKVHSTCDPRAKKDKCLTCNLGEYAKVEELDDYDVHELERKQMWKEKAMKKKRGRPKKFREEEEADEIDEEDVPIRTRDLAVIKGRKVVVPFMRKLYGWYKW
jgi:hypothetical protein